MLTIKIILTTICIGLFFVASCGAQTGAIPLNYYLFKLTTEQITST